MAFGKQKNRLKMPRRRHLLARLVTRLQLRNAHMFDDPSHLRLPRIMALLSISPFPPQESRLVESITRKPYETSFPREVCEGVLAHVVGGVEGAYRRSDALEKRRALLAAWAVYIESRTAATNVITLIPASR